MFFNKKRGNKTSKSDKKAMKEHTKKVEEKRKFIVDYLGIEKIEKGIVTRENTYTVFVKVKGINYKLYNEEGQESLIYSLQSIMDLPGLEKRILMVSERIDTSKYSRTLNNIESTIDPTDPKGAEQLDLLDDYKALAVKISSEDYSQRNYYIALSISKEQEISSLIRQAQDFAVYLKEANLMNDELEAYISTDEIYELYHNLINPAETSLINLKL